MEPKIHLLTFADKINDNKYYDYAQQLVQDATNYNIFSTIKCLTAVDLFKYTEFHKHILFISENKRGFGYWLWKPFLIWKTLEELPEGDLLVYLDAGTKLSLEGKSRFMDYLEIQRKDKYNNLFFEEENLISSWCKMDTIHFFDAYDLAQNNVKEILPGILFTCNNPHNRFLFKVCYDSCSNYQLITDTPSIKPNLPEFMEHRHDQSVFSIVVRKFSASSIYPLLNELKKSNKVYPITIRGALPPEKIIKVYTFWLDSFISQEKKILLDKLSKNQDFDLILVILVNYNCLIYKTHPLHEGFQYLSSIHKSEYLRIYTMLFYGGGCTDLQEINELWSPHFKTLFESDKWICGYPENGVIGSSAYICKPQNLIIKEIYAIMLTILDSKLESLKRNPAKNSHDSSEISSYPISKYELYKNIFYPICQKYKEKLLITLTPPT
jgi:hypothetical protein